MDKKKLKKNLGEVGRDIMVAFLVVAVIMLSLYAYCGIWPPMVVIESGSMEHPPSMFEQKSYVGTIDTGDMVFVKRVNGSYDTDVTTYVQGEAKDYSTYGSYGDVVIYRPNGLEYRGDGTPVIPIIHRLVVWLELNNSHVNSNFVGIDYTNYSFDVPSLGIYDSTDPFTRSHYGYEYDNITINLGLGSGLLRYYEGAGILPHGGYITMGDNNAPAYDQPYSGGYEPVLPEWIIGKAWGELPWFGLIKLWVNGTDTSRVPSNSWTGLFASFFLLLLVPFLLDYLIPKVKNVLIKKDGEKDDLETGPDEMTVEEIDPGKDETPDNPNSVPEENSDEVVPEDAPKQYIEKETVIIKEIVKVPCPHCGILNENTENKCSSCGAPLR